MSFVDLMGDVTYTEHQIGKRLHNIERNKYTHRDETILNRMGSGVALGKRPVIPSEDAAMNEFGAFINNLSLAGDEARADNDLLIKTLGYEKAQVRLDKYILLDGQVGQSYVEATYDEFNIELTPEIPYIPTYDPLPESVESVDEDGIPIQIRNPLVVQDELERTEAQVLTAGASQAVLGLATARTV